MSPLVGTWSSAYGGVGNDSVGELVLWIGLLAVVLVASRIRLQVAWVASAALCFFNPWFFAVLVVVSYRVGFSGHHARAAAPGFVAIVAAVTPLALIPAWRTSGAAEALMSWLIGMMLLVFTGVLPWLVGRYWRHYQQLVNAGWERAEQLERERRILTEQARLRERSRIAQDMHDALGHELSLIALRAGALEVDPALSDRHREAARELRAGAAAATERLREIIGVLREPAQPAPLAPVQDTVIDLVQRVRDSGMDVRLRRLGSPSELPELVDRAIYHVVREALTNVAKHASGATVSVRLEHRHDETVVTVSNQVPPGVPRVASTSQARAGSSDARAAASDPRAESFDVRVEAGMSSPSRDQLGGFGLIGLRERVRLVGGQLRAGPRDGGFEVVARLPHRARPATTPVTPHAINVDGSDIEGNGADANSVGGNEVGANESESARRRQQARRRARAGLVATVAVPSALASVVVVLMMSLYLAAAYLSVLPPAEFERIPLGAARGDVEAVLPPIQMVDAPAERSPAPPAGAECQHYRPKAGLGVRYAYRLCFVEGRLVGKYAVPTGSVSPSEVPTRGTGTL